MILVHLCRLHMSSTRSSLPRTISSKGHSAMLREPAKAGAPPDDKPTTTPNAKLGNLQNFLHERVTLLTKALEAKASTDFHDWLVSQRQHRCGHTYNYEPSLPRLHATRLWPVSLNRESIECHRQQWHIPEMHAQYTYSRVAPYICMLSCTGKCEGGGKGCRAARAAESGSRAGQGGSCREGAALCQHAASPPGRSLSCARFCCNPKRSLLRPGLQELAGSCREVSGLWRCVIHSLHEMVCHSATLHP